MKPDTPPEVLESVAESMQLWRTRLVNEPWPELLAGLRTQSIRSSPATFVYAQLLDLSPEDESASLLEEILTGLSQAPGDVCLGGALQTVLDAVPLASLGDTLKRVYRLLPADRALDIALTSWLRLIDGVPFDEFRRPFEVCERERNEDGGLLCSAARMEFWTRIALKARPDWWLDTFRHWSAATADAAGGSQLWPALETWGAYVAVRTAFLQGDSLCRSLDEAMQQVASESPDAREQFIKCNRSIFGDFLRLERAFPLTSDDVSPAIKGAWYAAASRHFEERLDAEPMPASRDAVSMIPMRWQFSKLRIPWNPQRWSTPEGITMGVLFLGLPILGIGFGYWFDVLMNYTGTSLWFALAALPLGYLGWMTQTRSGHPPGSTEMLRTYREAIRGELVRFLHEYPLTRPELLRELRTYVAAGDAAAPFLQEAEHDAALWFYALAARITA